MCGAEGKEDGVSCLHTHEDAPGIVRCRIDESDEETTHKKIQRCITDVDSLDKVMTDTRSKTL